MAQVPDNTIDNAKDEHVRQRAYEIWEREGRLHGDPERHWNQATKELEDEGRGGSSHSE